MELSENQLNEVKSNGGFEIPKKDGKDDGASEGQSKKSKANGSKNKGKEEAEGKKKLVWTKSEQKSGQIQKSVSEAWNSKAEPSAQSTLSEGDDEIKRDIKAVNLKEMRVLLNVLNEVIQQSHTFEMGKLKDRPEVRVRNIYKPKEVKEMFESIWSRISQAN